MIWDNLLLFIQTMTVIPVLDLLRYSSLEPSAKTSSLLMFDTTHSPPVPLPLKLGDADLDGYPDLLFIVVTPDNERVPKLAWSVECSVGEPGCPPIQPNADVNKTPSGVGGRGYVVASSGGDASVLAKFKDARSVSFLDLDEDGTLDILIQRSGTGTGGGGIGSGQKVNFIQNNVFHDAFFMKAIGTHNSNY
jgi:integrin alpha FG-GAP repeat containing protein 1